MSYRDSALPSCTEMILYNFLLGSVYCCHSSFYSLWVEVTSKFTAILMEKGVIKFIMFLMLGRGVWQKSHISWGEGRVSRGPILSRLIIECSHAARWRDSKSFIETSSKLVQITGGTRNISLTLHLTWTFKLPMLSTCPPPLHRNFVSVLQFTCIRQWLIDSLLYSVISFL